MSSKQMQGRNGGGHGDDGSSVGKQKQQGWLLIYDSQQPGQYTYAKMFSILGPDKRMVA